MSFFENLKASLPADQLSLRRDALDRFEAAGWPGPAFESWHYSDWSGLAAQSFASMAPEPPPVFTLDTAQPLPFVALDPVQTTTGFALDSLNRAFATEGVDKTIDGHARIPFLVTQAVTGAGAMRHLRHRLGLARGARATVVLWDAPGSGDADSLLTSIMALELAADSHLTLLHVQDADAKSTRGLHLAATLAEGAELQLIQLDFGGARMRLETEVTLAAPGAVFEQTGLMALDGRRRVDRRNVVWHAAPRCTSRTAAKVLAAGQSRAILNAQVQVQPGADKTQSETRIASLLLSDKAEIDAKPELEIHADDVQCAHGATFGQLDEDAAFYLRSRGLGAGEAQALLTQAFAQTALDRIPLPGVRAWAEARVQALLGAHGA